MHNTNYSNPTVANIHFSGNDAAGNGGGMYNNQYSSPNLSNVSFSSNQGANGGGVFNDKFQ